VGHTCKIVEEALKRYYNIILSEHKFLRKHRQIRNEILNEEDLGDVHYLDVVNVHLMDRCEDIPPHNQMDESCKSLLQLFLCIIHVCSKDYLYLTDEVKINSPDYTGQGKPPSF